MTINDTKSVHLTRDFETNGQVIPAGNHSLPTDLADDLIRRQSEYDKYREGITEKREYVSKAGQISMGDGE